MLSRALVVPLLRVVLAAAFLAGCRGDAPTAPRDRSAALVAAYFGDDSVRWFRHDTAGACTMRPLLDDSRVYFERDVVYGSDAGQLLEQPRLVALDRETGALRWSGEIVTATDAAIAGAFVAAIWGGLQTFHRVGGAPGPLFVPEGTSLQSNVVSDGERWYAGAHDGRVFAVDPAGTTAWTARLGEATPVFGVTLAGDLLIATAKWFAPSTLQRDSGIVAAFDRASGAVRWRVAMPDSLGNAGIVVPAVVSGEVAVVTTQLHQVRALDLATGAVRWRHDARGTGIVWASTGLAACDGRIIVATGNLGLAALDAGSGEVQWRVGDLQSGSLLRVDCAHGTVQARGSRLTIHDAASGGLLRRYPEREVFGPEAEELYVASVTRDARTLYVGTVHGFAAVAAP